MMIRERTRCFHRCCQQKVKHALFARKAAGFPRRLGALGYAGRGRLWDARVVNGIHDRNQNPVPDRPFDKGSGSVSNSHSMPHPSAPQLSQSRHSTRNRASRDSWYLAAVLIAQCMVHPWPVSEGSLGHLVSLRCFIPPLRCSQTCQKKPVTCWGNLVNTGMMQRCRAPRET